MCSCKDRPGQMRLYCSRCGHHFSVHRVDGQGYHCRRCACERTYWR